jgi:hypothetical protein
VFVLSVGGYLGSSMLLARMKEIENDNQRLGMGSRRLKNRDQGNPERD